MTPRELEPAGRLEVVLRHQAAVLLDAADELLELQHHEAAVGTELDDVALDLLGDAPHHLGALQHGGDVAHGDEVFDLERGQRAAHRIEPGLVAAEDLQRLVGAREHPRDRLERVLLAASVDRDQRHVLRHGDHRDVELAADALGGAVPGAGLRRGHVGIGHEVHVGAGHPRRVGRQDDGAVHLGQLREPLGRELGVEQEPARAHREHLGPVAHDDQRAHARLQDAVEALTQRRPRRHQPQGDHHGFRSREGGHGGLSLCGAGEWPKDTAGLRRELVRVGGSTRRDQRLADRVAHAGHLDHVETVDRARPHARPSGSPRGGTRGAPPRPVAARAAAPSAPRRPGRARRPRRCRAW